VAALGLALVLAFAFGEAAAGAQAKPKTAVSTEDRARLQALQAGADALRIGLALDPGKTFAALDRPEQLALADAMGPGDARRGVRLTLFIRGATMRLGEASGGLATVGYYNPVVDVWLVTRWTRFGGAWTLGSAVWITGAELRPPGERASWLERLAPWGQALVEGEGQALAGFDQRLLVLALATPGGDRTDLAAETYRRIDAMAAGLAPWMQDPARRGALEAVLTALRTNRAGALGPAAGSPVLRKVPPQILRDLKLVAALDEPTGPAVLLASLHAPDVVIAAEFDHGPRLQKLTVLNLSARAPTNPDSLR
jgi:hypothetical protein